MAKRVVFEEVAAGAKPASTTGAIDAARRGARRAIRAWLLALFGLVVLMIAVGGLTRLSDAGLSITEWRPVTGALPPTTDADWASEWAKYQASPQYQLMNNGMELAEFKRIYWWEWGHRQLGRLVGLVWALGFLVFLLSRRIPVGWTGRLLLIGALGGAQAAIGWWMVASGLTGQMVSVASYRLALHLGLAFTILGLLAHYGFLLGRSEADLLLARRVREQRLFRLNRVLTALVLVQVLLGALVAGIDAGRGFTDWPLMAGQVLPPDAFVLQPLWHNFFENPGLVQFVHRLSGYGLFLYGGVVWLIALASVHQATRRAFHAVAGMLVVQMGLGILTVLHGAPLGLAIAHQFGAVMLWVLVVRGRFLAAYPRVQSIRRTA